MPGAYKRFTTSQIPSQEGVVAVVTGGNGGIGYETTKQLALAGAKVYLAARSEEKANKAIEKIKSESGGKEVQLNFLQLDLADLKSAQNAAEALKAKESAIHLIIANAGLMAAPYELTKDGIEIQFQTNYLTHWLFITQLADQLKNGAQQRGRPSRVVTLSSFAHNFITWSPFAPKFDSVQDVNRKFGPSTIGAYYRYSQAKLAMIYLARQINNVYQPNEIRAAAVHPGFIATDLYKHTPGGSLMLKILSPVEDGALASLYVGTSDEVEKEDSWNQYRGTYGIPARQTAYSTNDKLALDLWDLSSAIVQQKL
ncbi:unnamed protein product [Sympodiomycopsis kandeliae]